jgi:uncharacterized membrane protein YphA (DoxX/SURF4 family)
MCSTRRRTRMKRKTTIAVTIISFLLVLLFSYAAISKMLEFHKFAGQLRSSPLLQPISGILTWLIPASELYAVILLLVPYWRRSGLLMAAIIMTAFTLYISVMLLFFDKLPCSCGGVFERMSWSQHLIFNIAFTVLAFAGLLLHKPEQDLIAIGRRCRKPETE